MHESKTYPKIFLQIFFTQYVCHPTRNHRFQRYLKFINQRTLYYQMDSESMRGMDARHEDIGKAMEM